MCLLAALLPASVAARPARAELIVVFKPGTTAPERAALHEALGGRRVGSIPAVAIDLVQAAEGAAAIYEAAPGVAWVGTNDSVAVHSPNDSLLAGQWALAKMGVFQGWRSEDGRQPEVTIAVIDTGVDADHPDLKGKVMPGPDYVEGDDDPDDDHGHGTHAAGIAAAVTNNARGIAGLSWGAEVLAIKALNEDGVGDAFSVMQGVVAAADAGAKVVNMSLGGEGDDLCPAFTTVARYASLKGTLLIASAGNGAMDGNAPSAPATCDGYLAVGATDQHDGIAAFSNHGDYVDVSAPGVLILSTVPPKLTPKASPKGYALFSGTSMAAPQVSGLAALLFAQDQDRTPEEVEARILATAKDLGLKGRDDYFGEGRIDVAKALKKRS